MNHFAFISNSIDGEIRSFHLDGRTGELRPLECIPAGPVVMPLALSSDRQKIFAATRGAQPSLLTFSIDSTSGALSEVDHVDIASSKAYLTIDHADRFLFGASYGEDLLGVYRPGQQGAPLQIVESIKHAHCAIVSADDRFVYVSSLGKDSIYCFALASGDARDGEPPLQAVGQVMLDQGFGPRHLRLSPSGKHLYALSEFRAVIAVFSRNTETGALTLASVSPRPAALAHLLDGVARPNFDHPVQPDPAVLARSIWAADLQVHPNGRFIYASERTASLLLIYRLSDRGDVIDYVGAIETEQQPRGFKIDPSGTFLLACGEKSQQVTVYRINPDTGELDAISHAAGGRGANWIELVEQSPIDNVY